MKDVWSLALFSYFHDLSTDTIIYNQLSAIITFTSTQITTAATTTTATKKATCKI